MGRGENAGYQPFPLSHNVFKRPIPKGYENQGLFEKELTLKRIKILD